MHPTARTKEHPHFDPSRFRRRPIMRVIGFAGWSGAGKTTLLRRLIPLLTGGGLRVSTVKHAHHSFDIDKPGKDSWEHRQAGATEVLIASGARWALMHELRDEAEPPLPALLARLESVDLVLIEGFKRGGHPKIEVHRSANGKPLLHPGDPSIVALATDLGVSSVAGLGVAIPICALDDANAVAAIVLEQAVPVARFSAP